VTKRNMSNHCDITLYSFGQSTKRPDGNIQKDTKCYLPYKATHLPGIPKHLRKFDGTNTLIRNHVHDHGGREFVAQMAKDIMDWLWTHPVKTIDNDNQEGDGDNDNRQELHVGVMCTHGKHRSVVCVEELRDSLIKQGVDSDNITVRHLGLETQHWNKKDQKKLRGAKRHWD